MRTPSEKRELLRVLRDLGHAHGIRILGDDPPYEILVDRLTLDDCEELVTSIRLYRNLQKGGRKVEGLLKKAEKDWRQDAED